MNTPIPQGMVAIRPNRLFSSQAEFEKYASEFPETTVYRTWEQDGKLGGEILTPVTARKRNETKTK